MPDLDDPENSIETPSTTAQGTVPAAQTKGTTAEYVPTGAANTSPPSGRQVFRALRRQLTDEDLTSPGVHKLLLDNLETADSRCDELTRYVDRFHEADKKASVLEEKLRVDRSMDITFGVGVGVGCTMMGLAPTFWSTQPAGWLMLIVGVVLTVGASIARAVRR